MRKRLASDSGVTFSKELVVITNHYPLLAISLLKKHRRKTSSYRSLAKIRRCMGLFGARMHVEDAEAVGFRLRNPSAGVPQAEIILAIGRTARGSLPQNNAHQTVAAGRRALGAITAWPLQRRPALANLLNSHRLRFNTGGALPGRTGYRPYPSGFQGRSVRVARGKPMCEGRWLPYSDSCPAMASIGIALARTI